MIDLLFDKVAEVRNPSVLGLDTRLEYLPQKLLDKFDPSEPFQSAAMLLFEFNTNLIDAVEGIIGCVKLQSAYYEMYGFPGICMMAALIRYAKKRGMIVILDGKRNDIGTTADAYASAYLGETQFPDGVARRAFEADFLTVTPYLGADGIAPFVKRCAENKKGIFILDKTSNPSSGQLQDKEVEGRPVYDYMASLIAEWGSDVVGKYGYSSVGAVVGATYPEQGAALRSAYPTIPFLLPGYGAQGAKGADLALCFDKRGFGAVVNASRSLLCAHRDSYKIYYEATRTAAEEMREDLLKALADAKRLEY